MSWKNPIRPKPKESDGFDLDAALSESIGNGNGNANGKVAPIKGQPKTNGFDLDAALDQSLNPAELPTVKKKDGGSESASNPPLPSQNTDTGQNGIRGTSEQLPVNQPIPDFNFINRKGESVLHVGNDPLGNAVNNLQSQRQSIINRNIGSDATAVKTAHPIVNINGKDVAVTKGSDEVNNLDADIQDIKENAFSNQTAQKYLKQKLIGKKVALKAGNQDQLGLGHLAAPITPDSDLNQFDQQSLKQNLDQGNLTDQLAFDKIKKEQDLNNAIASSPNLTDAALKFSAAQNPTVGEQVAFLQSKGDKLPDAYAGQLVYNFLNSPDIVQRAESNPEFHKQYAMAQSNLFNQFPSFAKKMVATKISQAREDAGLNNSIVNIPTQESTDKVVNDLFASGKMNDAEKTVYEKQIRPSIGVLQSIGRGIGRLIPGVQAAVDESPIATSDFFSNFQNSYVNTLHGMAKSIEDVVPSTSVNADNVYSNSDKLKNSLQNDYSVVNINPKGFWNDFGHSAGNMTGFVVPMIMGGAATKAIGAGATAGGLITNGLIFESQNKENALKQFPLNPDQQFLYTTLATAGDMMIGKLLPTEEARKGISRLLKDDIANTVVQFTDGNITAAAARNTILKKATGYVGDVVEGNLHAGTAMAGFGLLHNGLDAAFGGRDVSLGDAANEAIQNFKSGFLGTTPISAMAALNGNPQLNGKVILEMASNPEHYKQVIEDQAKLNPNLQETKDEKIRNLNEAALINKDLQTTDLDNDKKGKYIIQALNQKVWERKAEKATNEVLKNDYLSKAKESEKIQKDILEGNELPTEEITAKDKYIKYVEKLDGKQSKSFYENPLQDAKNMVASIEKSISEGETYAGQKGNLNRYKNFVKEMEQEISSQSKTNQDGQSKKENAQEAQTQENGQQIGVLKDNKGAEVETAPSIENLKKVELNVFDEKGEKQKYKDIELDDPVSGKKETLTAQKAKIKLENRHDILNKLIDCLTSTA